MLEQRPIQAVKSLSLEISKTPPGKVICLKIVPALTTTKPLKVPSNICDSIDE